MASLLQRRVNGWISSLKNGEISKVLADVTFIEELKSGANEALALNVLCVLSSKIYKLRKCTNEVIIDSTKNDTVKLAELCCIACQNIRISESQINKFLIALYHVIDNFIDEGSYDLALLLKKYIVIAVSSEEYNHKDDRIVTLLRNLYLKFWNGSILHEKNNSEKAAGTTLDLRIAAIEILCHTSLTSLPTVSERSFITLQKYLLQTKENFSQEKIFKFCDNILDVITVMVDDVLKLETNIEKPKNIADMKDWSILAFKPFCEVITEVLRVYNLFGKGIEGLQLFDKYRRKLNGFEKPRVHFCGFLNILQEVLSKVIYTFEKKLQCDSSLKDFDSIYDHLCQFQNSCEETVNNFLSKTLVQVISCKSSSFITSTASVCRALVDIIPKQNWLIKSQLRGDDRDGLLQLLKLSAELNFEFENDFSTSLKAVALSIRFIIQGLNECSEKENLDSSNSYIIKVREALNFGLKVEEKAPPDLSYRWKVAVNMFFQSIHGAMEVFIKMDCFEACEIFLVEYYKLALRWQNFPEFTNLKNNLWWGLKCLCVCRSKQKKFREALSALAVAVNTEASTDYTSIFNEWVKVKIKAQLSKKDDRLKFSTVYHLLKENIKDEEWKFTEKELCHLLRLEIYAYTSREVCMSDAIKDACHTILVISNDTIARAEAQLCLMELSWQETSSHGLLTASWKVDEKCDIGDQDIDNVKVSLNLCEKLAFDLEKEIVSRNNSASEDISVILCLNARTHYWIFLCLANIRIDRSQKELNHSCGIPLKALKNDEGEREELGEGNSVSSCDIMPAQWSLKSSQQFHLLKSSLNVALSLWEKALLKGMNKCNCENINVAITLKCIETAAHIYDLYDDLAHTVIAWSLLCQYAEIFDNDEAFLIGTSSLMRIGNVSLNKTSLKKAQNIAAKIGDDTPVLLSYWLGRSWQYLYVFELTSGLDYLKKVLDHCNPKSGCMHSIIYAQAKFLLAIYCLDVALPSNLMQADLSADPIFVGSGPRDSAISGIGVLVRLIEDWSISGSLANYFFAQSLLLNMSAWLGELFLDLNSPREAYGFLREQFLLAQRLLLPNRTVWFLSLLAQVDIMCQNVTDCVVKLNGMEIIIDILQKRVKNEEEADTKLENLFEGLKVEDSTGRIGKRTSGETHLRRKVGRGRKLAASEENSITSANVINHGSSPELRSCSSGFPQMPKCKVECICPLCMDSGFQKAFLGMVLVKVWVLFQGNPRDFLLKDGILRCAENLIKDTIIRHKKLVISEKKIVNEPYCLESDLHLKDCTQNRDTLVPLQILHVRFMLNMVDCYSTVWEATDVVDDIIAKSETSNEIAMEELKTIKYSSQARHLRARAMLQKIAIVSVRKKLFVNQREAENECLIAKEINDAQASISRHESWKTPERSDIYLEKSAKHYLDDNSVEMEVFDEPLPTGKARILPCLNLDAKLKEEEEVSEENKDEEDVPKLKGDKIHSNKNKQFLLEKMKKGKANGQKKGGGQIQKIGVHSLISNIDVSESTQIPSCTYEKQSQTYVNDDEFICDSPGAVSTLDGLHKKKVWSLSSKEDCIVQRALLPSLDMTKSDDTNNAAISNAFCERGCIQERDFSTAVSSHLSAIERNMPGEDDVIVEEAKKVFLKTKGYSDGDGKNKTACMNRVSRSGKQNPPRKVKVKKDSFIDDSDADAIIVAKKEKAKKLPKNAFLH